MGVSRGDSPFQGIESILGTFCILMPTSDPGYRADKRVQFSSELFRPSHTPSGYCGSSATCSQCGHHKRPRRRSLYAPKGPSMRDNQYCTIVCTCTHATARRSGAVVSNRTSDLGKGLHAECTSCYAHPIALRRRDLYSLCIGIVRAR